MAVGLTACIFALSIRDILHNTHRSGLLLPHDFRLLPGWPLVAANVTLYAYVCWLAFCFIRGTHGRERIFVIGWFWAILLQPLERFQQGFTVQIRCLCALGLTAALVAGVLLWLHSTGVTDSNARTA